MNTVSLMCFVYCFLLAMTTYGETNIVFEKDVWPQLYPSNETFEVCLARLKTCAQDASNRTELIAFVDKHLRGDALDDKTQMTLGIVVRALESAPYTNDSAMVRSLIKNGKRFLTFYGESLIETPPAYIDINFDVFATQTDLVAYAYNFENQQLVPYVIQDDVLQRLKKATRQTFGRDREAWVRWWKKEGRFWSYNVETREYGPKK